MIRPDNTNVKVDIYNDRAGAEQLKEYINWLKERNIKFSLVKDPVWWTEPSAINMRNEDAVAFKLRFKL